MKNKFDRTTEIEESLQFKPVDQVWNLIKEKLKIQIESLVRPRLESTNKNEEQIKMKCEYIFTSEKDFFYIIYEKIREIVEKNPKSEKVILFDIDETIGSAQYVSEESVETTIRPSLKPLLDIIQRTGFKIGILSSRGKKFLKEQLKDLRNLASLQPYIDPLLVYSSADMPFIDSAEEFKRTMQTTGIKIISDSVSNKNTGTEDEESNKEISWGIIHAEQQKITTLYNIKRKSENTIFVVVDDSFYPNLLNEEKGVYGISLHEKGKFFIPRRIV